MRGALRSNGDSAGRGGGREQAFNAFENDPAGGWGEGGESGRAVTKGWERSRLVDEGDKKFIRRSVGAAPPGRSASRTEERGKRDELGEEGGKGRGGGGGGERNKVAIHLAKRERDGRAESSLGRGWKQGVMGGERVDARVVIVGLSGAICAFDVARFRA